MDRSCPACGEENPERAKFCLICGAALTPPPAAAEERKIVSVLFVDLVGSTAAADGADPEDVRATLGPYHARVKQEIERFGGTVEKFVGDAVMAVFGAPLGREDDAERAVRAGLRIVEDLGERARAAINTGEALVSVGARAEAGEALVAGDVVNTAARMQTAAPAGALVVGEATERATRQAIVYEPLPPVELKGKRDPVPLFRALEARSRFGIDVEQPASAPLVGREHELTLLQNVYARTLRESSAQLVTLAGEPGVGKSRLVSEFRQWADDQAELVWWRQGRCLPYGESLTFWALGEVVKAQAGILETESEDDVARKLEQAIEALAVEEGEWLRARLAPLVGVAAAGEAADRAESFTAWLRFLEAMAAARPLVLVLEDLHWADDAMLDFVDHVVEWSSGVPLLILCTARPELYERRPAWAGGQRNATTISLSPLSPEETAHLLALLLDRAVLPAETQQALLERSGGNPLYAEQFARMLADRGSLEGDIPVPETVQAVIAARLDTLPPDRKALLHDAAVVGKVFWTGALASIGNRDERDVGEGLHQLVRKELVRPARTSSMEGQTELSFWHLLVRDVAYAQIPRAARATKHRATAEWIQHTAADRVADHAELIAHHYTEALALARAADEKDEAAALEEPARSFLELAGDRALKLDVAKASAYYGRALDLLPPGHPHRAAVLMKAGRTESAAGNEDAAIRMLEEAIPDCEARGDVHGAGAARGFLSQVMWTRGDTARAGELINEARELLERTEPSPELAMVYGRSAFRSMMRGEHQQALALAERGLALAEQLGPDIPVVPGFSLMMRGMARASLGDADGLDDLREALRRADGGPALESAVASTNLAWWLWTLEGAAAALEVYSAGIDRAERRGARWAALWAKAETTWPLYDLGRWDELLRVADDILEVEREQGPTQRGAIVLTSKARVLVARGHVAEAAALVDEFLPAARAIGDAQVLLPAIDTAALVAHARADREEVLRLLADLPERRFNLGQEARLLVAAGALERAGALLDLPAVLPGRIAHARVSASAVVAEARGELDTAAALYGEAAERWAGYGNVVERAHALLGRGRCEKDGAPHLREARQIFAELGAVALVAETDVVLGERAAAS